MFQFLQRNSSVNYILLPIIVLLLWGSNFFEPQFVSHYYDETPMVLYKPLVSIQNCSPFIGQLMAIVILALNVVALVKVNSNVRLIEKRSIFYVLLFVIFSASLQDFKQLNPMQPSLFFLILGIASLFKMYKQERELRSIFECGVCFSLASLFYAPAIYFSLIIFLGLMTLVPFYWRQWLSALIGVVLPIFLVFACVFCFGVLSTQINVWKVNLLTERTVSFNYFFPLIFSCYLALIVILSVVYSFSGGLKKVVSRKYYFIFLLMLILVVCVYLFLPYVGYQFLFYGLLPVSIFVANYMLNIRNKFFVEALFWLIIAFTVLVQIFPDKIIAF
ncbi:MAG: DUF6427 family protein [Bacteroidales bacterium]|nr:DUF6427 family protein [Bacteroidales bacterium]